MAQKKGNTGKGKKKMPGAREMEETPPPGGMSPTLTVAADLQSALRQLLSQNSSLKGKCVCFGKNGEVITMCVNKK